MFRVLLSIVLFAVVASTSAQESSVTAQPEVGFSIIRTGNRAVSEGMLYAGGSFGKEVEVNFSAILVKHGRELFLFDSGLGSRIAEQYRQDMPLWARSFFKYEDPVSPAQTQLVQAGFPPIERIILSHSHWDHASALGDFPQAQVWASAPEMEVIRHAGASFGGSWPSQVSSRAIDWHTLEFKPVPYEGFDSSIDLFQDGKVVLVPLFGHTPGSVGMFVTVDSGKRYFFVGDVVWRADALAQGHPKFWPARVLVDHAVDQTQQTIEQIRRVMAKDPRLVVVPAHDGSVQSALGYFPQWVK
jgi:glyoxylase-like metal-dependent hydrolase (beta-lactamase superfamily II)